MNVNKTFTDYKRIIETNLNLNQPRTPQLLRVKNIAQAIETDEMIKWHLTPFGDWQPTPDIYARAQQKKDANVRYHVEQFLKEQERITNRRNSKKENYGRKDYIDGTDIYRKNEGHMTAKIIHDARTPPEQVEQDRKMLDYTLRTCEYIKRIQSVGIEKLEPNLKHIKEQFQNGDWSKIFWYDLGMASENVDKLNYLFYLHRVHVSLTSPLQIAHYPTLRHLRERREVITKLGKYLTTFKDFIGLNESEIKNYVEKYNSIVAGRTGWTINFIESNDADGFVKIYENSKARSCMTCDHTDIKNAIRTYAHEKSVIRLAYMTNGADEILARSLVREDLKQYVRIYPDPNGTTEGRYLRDFLKANGYELGNLEGCLLKAIPYEYDGDIYRAPYIDAGNSANGSEGSVQSGEIVEIDGKEYIKITAYGDLDLTNTSGYTADVEDDDEDYSTCECCDNRVHNDDTTYTAHDEYVCQTCIEDRYVWAWVSRGQQEYVHQNHVLEISGSDYWDECEFSDFDIYYCEVSDEYFHIDDLVNTSMGLIHIDYAKPIDHEDADGNNYAHHEEVHTLSDGTTCHKEDAEELQAKIDEDNSDTALNTTTSTEDIKQNENI